MKRKKMKKKMKKLTRQITKANRKMQVLQDEHCCMEERLRSAQKGQLNASEFIRYLQTTNKAHIDALFQQAEDSCQTDADYAKLNLLRQSAHDVNYRNYTTRTKSGEIILDIHQMPSLLLNCSTEVVLKPGAYKVITLCGSTKFKKEYEIARETLTKEGCIILACPIFHHADGLVLQQEEYDRYDDMHRQRIRMSDAIYVINKGGYIGESTKHEIAYAKELGKEVLFFEKES